MGDFLKRHAYIVIWILALIIIGSLATLILQLNSYIPTPLSPAAQPGRPTPAGVPAVAQPSIPPPPEITLTIVKSPSGNSLFIQWQNLPGGTAVLNIYRGKTGTDPSKWLLWKTLSLAGYDLTNGMTQIGIGNASENGYSFSVAAVGETPGDGTGGGPTQVTLWESSSTVPSTGTTPPPPQTPVNPPDENPPPAQNPSSTSSSTPETPPNNPPSNPGNNPPPTPTGTPYYNPEVQIETYGSGQSGNFWVQHVDQKIQIGWQNLPQGVTDITVTRSENQDGPWETVLTQENPGTTGAYSLQVVDDTLGTPYYYEMNALQGTSTLATYGPAYLAGQ